MGGKCGAEVRTGTYENCDEDDADSHADDDDDEGGVVAGTLRPRSAVGRSLALKTLNQSTFVAVKIPTATSPRYMYKNHEKS